MCGIWSCVWCVGLYIVCRPVRGVWCVVCGSVCVVWCVCVAMCGVWAHVCYVGLCGAWSVVCGPGGLWACVQKVSGVPTTLRLIPLRQGLSWQLQCMTFLSWAGSLPAPDPLRSPLPPALG